MYVVSLDTCMYMYTYIHVYIYLFQWWWRWRKRRADRQNRETPSERERKYIVFESSLKELLGLCRVCGSRATVIRKRTIGSMVIMESVCDLTPDHTFTWNSQPLGNLLISAAILFSGSSPVKTVNILKFSRIETFRLRTYHNIQGSFLLPAISSVWEQEQQSILEAVDGPLKLGGDARCCSPGLTAKYGGYTIMDLETSKVIDVELLQVWIKNIFRSSLKNVCLSYYPSISDQLGRWFFQRLKLRLECIS